METIKIILGAPLAVVAFFIGDFDIICMTLLSLVVIDFVTGILKGIHNKNLNSEIMFKGGIKKIGILLIVAVANIIDNALEFNGAIRSMAMGYYIANESLSIMENWGGLDLPLPKKLMKVLEQLHEADVD